MYSLVHWFWIWLSSCYFIYNKEGIVIFWWINLWKNESNRIFSLHNVKHTKCYLFNGPFIAHFPFGDGVIDSSWWTLVQKIQFYLFVQVLKQIVITGANSYFVLLWEKFKVIHFRWVKMIGVWKLPAFRWTFIYSMFDWALKMTIKLLINLSKFFVYPSKSRLFSIRIKHNNKNETLTHELLHYKRREATFWWVLYLCCAN